MKCIECALYSEDNNSCASDGDTSNPTEDIFCAEAGDLESDYFPGEPI